MALDRLTLQNFRNHAATRLADTRGFNVLVGENGAGKTNVLEALSLFAPGRGLRRAQAAEMAGRTNGDVVPASGFSVAAELENGAVVLSTATLASAPNRRMVRINGAEGPAARLGEWLSINWLTPAMDRLFAEGPGARRRFLDRMVLARDPGHARLSARYETALRERNRLLSEPAEPDPAWLDALEVQLAECGAAIGTARAGLVAALTAVLATQPEHPFARPLLVYAGDVVPDEAALRSALRAGRRRERAAGRTLAGPHRDDLVVTLAAKAAPAADCSTGEQKAMLIAIVLAHAGLAHAEPSADSRQRLLLLDEIAAHLDPLRRAALFDRLRDSGAQVWMTGTEIAPFADIAGEAAVWRVADGQVERV
ncbi:DNA replication/repair protein RecF [Novosphingobium lentum]|uniref:DNA replication/repair protein RecF n=1 Tax=Novosphingobium lentum TaxID=145287 RepID=UPI00082E69CA|nr:DNA replication/repair protein RecF [Novosphingobium lentum]